MQQQKGFTLIEIIIVIALISLLSVIGLTNYNRVQSNAQKTKAQADLREIEKNIVGARAISGKTLYAMTGNPCSSCTSCRDVDLRNVPDEHPCVERWKNIQNTLAQYGADIRHITRDPWGSPYTVDENDGEPGQPGSPCRQDNIRSPGPDGFIPSASIETHDDIIIRLSMVSPGCLVPTPTP